jgi:hypothetical protein
MYISCANISVDRRDRSSCAVPRLDTAILYKGALESVSGARKGSNEWKDERVTIVLKQIMILKNNQLQTHLTEKKHPRMITLPELWMRYWLAE